MNRFLVWLLLVSWCLPLMAQPLVQFQPRRVTTYQGKTFTVNIVLRQAPATEGGGIQMLYPASHLSVLNVEVDGNVWNFQNRSGEIDNQAGEVRDILFSRFPAASGKLRIARVTFQAKLAGHFELRLQQSEINPFASGGERFDVSLVHATGRIRPPR